jgi:hypothetical protein
MNKASCASAPGDLWSFSLSNANAKIMYAQLLSAAAQGRTVEVVGFSCESTFSAEMPSAINVNY